MASAISIVSVRRSTGNSERAARTASTRPSTGAAIRSSLTSSAVPGTLAGGVSDSSGASAGAASAIRITTSVPRPAPPLIEKSLESAAISGSPSRRRDASKAGRGRMPPP
jgi:hypothetical protein